MKWIASKRETLAQALCFQLEGCSGKKARRLLEKNICRVDGRVERFGSRTLFGGELIELSSRWDRVLQEPKNLELSLVYEGEDFFAFDKPPGFLCTQSAVDKALGKGLFLVHRLDKGTSGLLLLAKNPSGKKNLEKLFLEKRIKKTYLALVDGLVKNLKGTIESHLVKKGFFQGQTIWGSTSLGGKKAITRWGRIQSGRKATLLKCFPLTGKTHQIRVHLAEMGHPILIDPQYGAIYRSSLEAFRPLLHAYRLEFSLFGEKIALKAPIPEDFSQSLMHCGIDFFD